MKRLLIGVVVAMLATVGIAIARGATQGPTETKIVGVYLANPDGTLGVSAKLKASKQCKGPYRKYVLFDQDGKVTTTRGQAEAFLVSDDIEIGDTIQVKAKSAYADALKCKGSISEPYTIDQLDPLPKLAAGDAIASKAKILGVFDESGDTVSIYGKIKTKAPCYEPKRKFTLYDQDGKIETHNGLSDAFFKTDEVGLGDVLHMKVSSATAETDSGDRVKCKGSTSKDFEVTEIQPG